MKNPGGKFSLTPKSLSGAKPLVNSKPSVPKRNRQLNSDVYDKLLLGILEGSVQPGTRLNEEKLAADLGVSRTPLREAFLRLAQNGFVYRSEKRGYYVQPLTRHEAREIYQIICGLEVLAVRLSGSLISLCVPELKKINLELANATSKPQKARDCDEQFHKHLLAYCDNKQLLDLIEHYWRVTSRYDRVYMSDAKLVTQSVKHHQQIIRCLEPLRVSELVKALETNWNFSSDVFSLKFAQDG
jgi:DNA-binding GntR family transcriptional regulator